MTGRSRGPATLSLTHPHPLSHTPHAHPPPAGGEDVDGAACLHACPRGLGVWGIPYALNLKPALNLGFGEEGEQVTAPRVCTPAISGLAQALYPHVDYEYFGTTKLGGGRDQFCTISGSEVNCVEASCRGMKG